MAGSVSGESWSFTLAASHAREVNAMFENVDPDGRSPLSAVQCVEQAIDHFINKPTIPWPELAPESEATAARRERLVRKIGALSGKLVELLNEYFQAAEEEGFEGDGLLDTLPGLLLLNANPNLREDINDPYPGWRHTGLSNDAISAFGFALEQAQGLQSASKAWLKRRPRRSKGALPGDQVTLVTELYGVVYSILMYNRPLLEKWQQRPAAPKGPLCRLCEIAWEALGRKPETNMPQLVRRSLAYHQAFEDQGAAHIDAWYAHVEQKCTPGSCDFCSG